MATTRSQRLARNARNIELLESQMRRSWNEIVRDRQQAAAMAESADLMQLFRTRPAEAWAQLAAMTEAQRINQAIDMACYLETQGVELAWGDIRQRWETHLAELAAARAVEAEALAEHEAAKGEADNNDCYGSYIAAQPRVRRAASTYVAARQAREAIEAAPCPIFTAPVVTLDIPLGSPDLLDCPSPPPTDDRGSFPRAHA
jgi:hypothetical protein